MEVWAICLLTIGMMLSPYYAYRGYEDNWFRQRELNAERKIAKLEVLSSRDIITVYCIPDAIFHFLSSITGFFVLCVVFKMYQSLKFDDPTLDTGTSLLLALSFVFGIIGALGQLPQLILQGKVPWLEVGPRRAAPGDDLSTAAEGTINGNIMDVRGAAQLVLCVSWLQGQLVSSEGIECCDC